MRQITYSGLIAAIVAIAVCGQAVAADEATVIELTQTPCQFLESENGVDHGYKSTSADDCLAVNKRSGSDRLAKAKVLELKPGRYVFRVTNENVPYELGFWIREHDYNWKNPLHKLTKTSLSGGGLTLGTTQDYAVELEPGSYLYSCPLNPTPDYRVEVKG